MPACLGRSCGGGRVRQRLDTNTALMSAALVISFLGTMRKEI